MYIFFWLWYILYTRYTKNKNIYTNYKNIYDYFAKYFSKKKDKNLIIPQDSAILQRGNFPPQEMDDND